MLMAEKMGHHVCVYVWIVHQELIRCICFRYNHFSISQERSQRERVFVCFHNKRIRERSIMFIHVDIVFHRLLTRA